MIGKTNAVGGGGSPKMLACSRCMLPASGWTRATGTNSTDCKIITGIGSGVIEHNGVIIAFPIITSESSAVSPGSHLYDLDSTCLKEILLSSFGIDSLSELPDGSYSMLARTSYSSNVNSGSRRYLTYTPSHTISFSISNSTLVLDGGTVQVYGTSSSSYGMESGSAYVILSDITIS